MGGSRARRVDEGVRFGMDAASALLGRGSAGVWTWWGPICGSCLRVRGRGVGGRRVRCREEEGGRERREEAANRRLVRAGSGSRVDRAEDEPVGPQIVFHSEDTLPSFGRAVALAMYSLCAASFASAAAFSAASLSRGDHVRAVGLLPLLFYATLRLNLLVPEVHLARGAVDPRHRGERDALGRRRRACGATAEGPRGGV